MPTMNRIMLCVSSCLLGNAVRYDGGHKLDRYLAETLSRQYELLPVCPEVECGLPSPREAMQLVGDAGSPRLITIETRIDHTGRVVQWVEAELARLAKEGIGGFIFKARSPSCAVNDAALCAPSGEAAGTVAGLFARAVMLRFPRLPVIDEESLAVPSARHGFLELVRAYCRCSGPFF